jgi:hypothetical protein
MIGTIGRHRLLAVFILPLACNRVASEQDTSRRRLELHDARGQSRQIVHESGEGGFRWQDRREGSGRVLPEPDGRRRAQDQGGSVVETPGPTPGTLDLRRADGSLLRVSREKESVRLGDGAGIPIARARLEKEEALVRDAGGQVILRARRAGGRIVVTDREGAAVGFVVGDAAPEAAALVWLPALTAAERVLLLTAKDLFIAR